MFKFEFPWTRKRRLAAEAAREAARLEEIRTRLNFDRLKASRTTSPWHLTGVPRVSPSTVAEQRRRLREDQDRQDRLRREREDEDRRRRARDDDDILTPIVVGMAINSMLNSSSHAAPAAREEEPWHGRGGETGGGGASASWEPREESSRSSESDSSSSDSGSSDSGSSDSGSSGSSE